MPYLTQLNSVFWQIGGNSRIWSEPLNGRRGTLGTLWVHYLLTISKGRCEFLLVRFHFCVKALIYLAFLLWRQIRLSWKTILPRFQTATPQMENPSPKLCPWILLGPADSLVQIHRWSGVSSVFYGGNYQWQPQLFHLCRIGPQSHSLRIVGSMVQLFLPGSNLDWFLVSELDWVLDKIGFNGAGQAQWEASDWY